MNRLFKLRARVWPYNLGWFRRWDPHREYLSGAARGPVVFDRRPRMYRLIFPCPFSFRDAWVRIKLWWNRPALLRLSRIVPSPEVVISRAPGTMRTFTIHFDANGHYPKKDWKELEGPNGVDKHLNESTERALDRLCNS